MSKLLRQVRLRFAGRGRSMSSSLLVVLLAVTLAGCGEGGGSGAGAPERDAPPPPELTAEETLPSDCVETSDITMVGSEFDPRCVSTSSPKVSVVNEDLILHSFTIRGTDVDVDVEDGKRATIDLSGAVEPGVLTEFYCKYHGPMIGDILVR